MAHAAGAAGAALALLVLLVPAAGAPPRYSSRIVHTEQGAIRGIIVEPASRRLEPVEVFLGVPYAAAPARLEPPPPAPRWPGTRLADAAPPECPTSSNTTQPQSEDCLYLSVWVPGSGARGEEAPYAVLVWLGTADGAVLAARAHLLVITVNYRQGLLGFLTLGGSDAVSSAGGAGLLDALAALRWAARHVAPYGGDPTRVTLAARGTHAAHANALLMLPEAHGLVSRVFLLSGSALAPAALSRDGGGARRHVAAALQCGGAAGQPLLACVRAAPLEALLAASPPHARFVPPWAPSPPAAAAPARALHASPAFLHAALAVVLASAEGLPFLSEDEIRHGFEEEHRNRLLRTFVRNVFRWHRNEIFAAVRNEYTDWDKPIQHPINIRDAALEALSDGACAAPAARLAQLHARRGAPTYLAHFAHQGRDQDYSQRLGSTAAESEAYFLGLPLVGGRWGGRSRNYSRADVSVSEHALALLASFAKTGAPAAPAAPATPALVWPRYELNTQQYLSIGSRVRVRSHYRGHKLALWLHLVPQLHRARAAPPPHHRLRADRKDLLADDVVPELYSSATPEDEDEDEDEDGGQAEGLEEEEEEEEGGVVEECAPVSPPATSTPSAPPPGTLATVDAHYYSYTVALGATVCAGCVLLALNALVFAGIYLQRRPRPRRSRAAAAPAPRRSRSTAAAAAVTDDLLERPAPPAKKRVQIQEISV